MATNDVSLGASQLGPVSIFPSPPLAEAAAVSASAEPLLMTAATLTEPRAKSPGPNAAVVKLPIRVTDPTKQGEGVKAFTTYQVSYTLVIEQESESTVPPAELALAATDSKSTVLRRYNDFKWLHAELGQNYAGLVIPPFPETSVVRRFTPEFVESRRRSLEKFLNRLAAHEDLRESAEFKTFLEGPAFSTSQTQVKPRVQTIGAQVSDMWSQGIAVLQQQQWAQCAVGQASELPTSPEDEAFDEAVAYVDGLYPLAVCAYQQTRTLLKKERELEAAQHDFLPSFVLLGKFDAKGSAEFDHALLRLEHASQAVDQLSADRQQSAETDALDVEEALEDYICIVRAVKDALLKRPARRSLLQRRMSELEAAKKAHAKSAESEVGVSFTAWRGTRQSREVHLSFPPRHEAKVEKRREAVDVAEQAVHNAKADLDLVTERLVREIERFKVEKVADFKAILTHFVSTQVGRCTRVSETWSDVVPALERTSLEATAPCPSREVQQQIDLEDEALGLGSAAAPVFTMPAVEVTPPPSHDGCDALGTDWENEF